MKMPQNTIMNSQVLQLTDIKAVIFDMDGTMVSNMLYHRKAWMQFAQRHEVVMSEADFLKRFSGRKNDQILTKLMGDSLTKEELNGYTDEKEAIYRELYAPDIKEVAGLTVFIRELQKRGLKLAIATTAPEKNRQFVLEKLGLLDVFQVI